MVAIDRDTFAAHYVRWAGPRCFAPFEPHWERACGSYFAVRRAGVLVAVYKLVDERAARRFIAQRGPGLRARAFARLYGRRGAAGLPRPGRELSVCYAAFYAARDQQPEFSALANHARDLYGDRISYLFLGVAESAVTTTRLPRGSLRFGSTHLGFGEVPAGVQIDFHELTLL